MGSSTPPDNFDDLIDGVTNVAFTVTNRTKLAGIADNATLGATAATISDATAIGRSLVKATDAQAVRDLAGLGDAATKTVGNAAGQLPVQGGPVSATTVTTEGAIHVGGVYGAGSHYTHLTDGKLASDTGNFTFDFPAYANFTGAIATFVQLFRGEGSTSRPYVTLTNGYNGGVTSALIITKITGGLADDGVSTLQVDGPARVTGSITTGGTIRSGVYTVATLPTPGTSARDAFASNGRKASDAPGAGTGVKVYDDGVAWRTYSTDLTVAA